MRTPLFKTISVGVLAASLLTPLMTSAATTQQLLNDALMNFNGKSALQVNADIAVNIHSQPVNSKTPATDGTVNMSLSERVVKTGNKDADAEGRFVLNHLDISQNEFPVQLTEPVSLQWKKVGTAAYVELEGVPQSLTDMMKSSGVDLQSLIGQWIRFDLNSAEITKMMPTSNAATTLEALPEFAQLKTMKNPLQVLRVESMDHRANGDTVARLRVRVNPALLPIVQSITLKAIPANEPNRATKIADVKKMYQQVATFLKTTDMVVVVNETTKTVERIEIGMQQVQPRRVCAVGSTMNPSKCPIVSHDTVKTAIGINFVPDLGAAIVAPAQTETPQEALAKLRPAASSTEDGTMTELSPMGM